LPLTTHTLSLHDALPISIRIRGLSCVAALAPGIPAAQSFLGQTDTAGGGLAALRHLWPGDRAVAPGHRTTETRAGRSAPDIERIDRKSTRLNSSHSQISY